jgi:hypothetical protein
MPRKDTMTEQLIAQRIDAAQDELAVTLQVELTAQQSHALSDDELKAVAGGPSIINEP